MTTKSDIVAAAGGDLDLPQTEIIKVFDAVLQQIRAALLRGEQVDLKGLGKLSAAPKDGKYRGAFDPGDELGAPKDDGWGGPRF